MGQSNIQEFNASPECMDDTFLKRIKFLKNWIKNIDSLEENITDLEILLDFLLFPISVDIKF